MAEFMDVVRGWNKLCNNSHCMDCSLFNVDGCEPLKEIDAMRIEREVEKFEAERSVNTYPTWYRWISDINGGAVVDHAFLLQPIPDDIAEKLGVKPLK